VIARERGRLVRVVALVVVCVVAAGCRSVQLDRESVEEGLAESLSESFGGAEVTSVRCPSAGEVEVAEGESFECTVTADGTRVGLTLRVVDDSGRMDYESSDVLLRTADVESSVADGVAESTRDTVEVDCGEGRVVAGVPPVKLECVVVGVDGFAQTASVSVADPGGAITWTLVEDDDS
jgi:hypothetical protein